MYTNTGHLSNSQGTRVCIALSDIAIRVSWMVASAAKSQNRLFHENKDITIAVLGKKMMIEYKYGLTRSCSLLQIFPFCLQKEI